MTSRRMMKAGLAIGLTASLHIAMSQVQLGATAGGGRRPRAQRHRKPARGGGQRGRRRSASSAADLSVRGHERTDTVCPVRFLQGHQGQEESADRFVAWPGRQSRHDGARKSARCGTGGSRAVTSSSRRWATTAAAGTAFRPARHAVAVPVAAQAAELEARGCRRTSGRRSSGRERRKAALPRLPRPSAEQAAAEAAAGCPGGGTAVTDAAKVRELSEKDVMTVLDMIRKEFNVDERRTYLMGHSMGGSGTLYLGGQASPIWAAVAAIAPPGPAVPASRSPGCRRCPCLSYRATWIPRFRSLARAGIIDRLKALNADYEYLEIPGADSQHHRHTGDLQVLREAFQAGSVKLPPGRAMDSADDTDQINSASSV